VGHKVKPSLKRSKGKSIGRQDGRNGVTTQQMECNGGTPTPCTLKLGEGVLSEKSFAGRQQNEEGLYGSGPNKKISAGAINARFSRWVNYGGK